jgi:hypothetical protein
MDGAAPLIMKKSCSAPALSLAPSLSLSRQINPRKQAQFSFFSSLQDVLYLLPRSPRGAGALMKNKLIIIVIKLSTTPARSFVGAFAAKITGKMIRHSPGPDGSRPFFSSLLQQAHTMHSVCVCVLYLRWGLHVKLLFIQPVLLHGAQSKQRHATRLLM